MSILRYERPAALGSTVPFSADEALLRLLLIAAGAVVSLIGWLYLTVWLQARIDGLLLGGCGLTLAGCLWAVVHGVLRPLWPRRYEGSAGVWGVMLLSLALLAALALLCWGCLVAGMVWQD